MSTKTLTPKTTPWLGRTSPFSLDSLLRPSSLGIIACVHILYLAYPRVLAALVLSGPLDII